MNNDFIYPRMTISRFSEDDVITASGGTGTDGAAQAEQALIDAGVAEENVTKIDLKMSF